MEREDGQPAGSRRETGDAGGQDLETLLGVVYDKLRAVARMKMRGERRGHTLQPTALVHEAVLRILGDAEARFESPGELVAAAARAMERVLIDHARRRAAARRSGRREAVPIDEVPDRERAEVEALSLELDAIAAALAVLERLDGVHGPRKAKAVRLRYFLGLSIEQTSAALEVSRDTVERDLRFALAWIHDRVAS